MQQAIRIMPCLIVLLVTHSCASQQKKKVSPERIQKAAALTKLTQLQHFHLMSKNNQDTDYCYIESKKTPFFVNSNIHSSGIDFLRLNLPGFATLSREDFADLIHHPHLKEIYCGKIYKFSRGRSYHFLFSIEDEKKIDIDKIEELHEAIKQRLKIPRSRLFFAYRDRDLYIEKRRQFIARKIPLRSLTSNSDANTKLIDTISSERNKDSLYTDLNTTKIEPSIITGKDYLPAREYGVLSYRSETSNQTSLNFPYALHDMLVRTKIDSTVCSNAKIACQKQHGNLCQYAHGQCLNETMLKRDLNFSRLSSALLSTPIFKDKNSKNRGLREGTLGFLASTLMSFRIDSKILRDYWLQIEKAFPDANHIKIQLSSNASLQNELPNLFNSSITMCIRDSVKYARCDDKNHSSNEKHLQQALLAAIAASYDFANIEILQQNEVEIKDLRFALRVMETNKEFQVMGYAYILPDPQTHSFSLKFVNLESKFTNSSSPTSEKPFYLKINTQNRITQDKRTQQKNSLTKRWDAPLPGDIIEKVAIKVKQEYLSQLAINKNSDKRLYTFKYIVDKNGNTQLTR